MARVMHVISMGLCAAHLSACAAHVEGMVAHDPGLSLTTRTGGRYRLVVGGEVSGLQALDGYFVDVWGSRLARTVRVTQYKVATGVHGMTAWVGPLSRHGGQLALTDRNTETLWFVHRDSEAALVDLVGHEVLIEGYVLGTQTIVAVHHDVLDGATATR